MSGVLQPSSSSATACPHALGHGTRPAAHQCHPSLDTPKVGWAPETTGHRGAILSPFELPALQSQAGGRSSTDLFSTLTIAPRFLISQGFVQGAALSEEQGRGGRAGPGLVPSSGGSYPSAPPPSSCHPSWHTPPSPVWPCSAQDLSPFGLQSAVHAFAWAEGEGESVSAS